MNTENPTLKSDTKKKRLNSKTEEFFPTKIIENEPPKRKQSTVEILEDIVSEIKDLYVFTHDFLRLEDYSNLENIRKKFSCLKNINEDVYDISSYVNANYFIMRSTMPDDIHKAMKYGVWTSTPDHNEILSKSYQNALQHNNKVILFFRVVSENKLLGVAELVSDFLPDIENNFWWDKVKWSGSFKLKWLFVKDISINSLDQTEHGKLLYELTDCSKISPKNGFFLLEFFKIAKYEFQQSLFKHFKLFDQREDYLLQSRTKTDFVISLKKLEKPKKNVFPSHEEKTRKPSFHMSGYIDNETQLRKNSHYNNAPYVNKKSNHKEEDLMYVKKEKNHEEKQKNSRKNSNFSYDQDNNEFNSYRKKSFKEEVEYIKKE
jgi:hypothetical protein